MKKVLIACAALAAFSSAAFAADGATLYKKCVACHGAKEDIIASLKGYKDGTLGDGKGKFGMMGVMKGQAASLNDESIEALADFIVSKK